MGKILEFTGDPQQESTELRERLECKILSFEDAQEEEDLNYLLGEIGQYYVEWIDGNGNPVGEGWDK